MDRRNFLTAMLASCMAPAIVHAGSIMRIKPLLLPGEDFPLYVGTARLSADAVSSVYSLGGELYSKRLRDELKRALGASFDRNVWEVLAR